MTSAVQGTSTSIKMGSSSVPEPELTEWDHIVEGIDDGFRHFAQFFHMSARPVPSVDDPEHPPEHIHGYVDDLVHSSLADVWALGDVIKLEAKEKPWDDRNYLLERMIRVGHDWPPNSKGSIGLTNQIVKQFWDDLHHPPISYLGHKHQYRSADGSYNNLFIPDLGKANTPYARTVPPMARPQKVLPDPGLLFDTIFKRRTPTKHPNKISSMLFYLATIIIHDLFRTSHEDPNISMTSSYLDLAPLYGSNQEEQNHMRTHQDGKIRPDSFSEKRIHGFPPGVSALLIMFNRFHNHVVENLAAINEDDRFNKESKTYDEDLFQVGRLVTCGLYINIILSDYIRTIVNLIRTKSTWKIDPRGEIRNGPPRATGNQVSVEFNLIYRWHAVVSERDAAWIERTYEQTFKCSPNKLSIEEMIAQLTKMETKMSNDPEKQPLLNQKGQKVPRDPQTGKFDDDELVKLLTESIEDCANAFGANQIPECLRVVEMMSIEQARKWQVGTLNEFRKYFNLKQYTTFEEINPDIADDLRYLYHTPDQVELYPGIICESTKRSELPGSGLMPGYTISRAILSDAITLIRADRFNTVEYNPKALTAWGYTEVDSNPKVDYGCCFYKLFYTAFPQHFRRNSVYAHYPLIIPSEMKNVLHGLETHDNYNYDKPARLPRQVEVTTWAGAHYVLKHKHIFNVSWRDAMVFMMGKSANNYMLAGDERPNEESRTHMEEALYSPPDWKREVRNFYFTKTRDLLRQKKHKFSGLPGQNMVDLIHEVTNIVHVYFCAEMFSLPLKSNEHHHAPLSEQEMYMIFCAVFICVFFDVDPENSFYIHNQARDAAKTLGKMIELNVKSIKHSNVMSQFIQMFAQHHESSPLRQYGEHMLKRCIRGSSMDTHELAWGHILATAGGMVPNQGQQFAELLEFYMFDPEGQTYWPDIVKTARAPETPETDERLLRYMMEGSRLACASAVTRNVNANTAHIPAGAGEDDLSAGKKASKHEVVEVHRGEKVFVNLWKASRDPKYYKNPDKVDLERDLDEDYICFGWGQHQCLGLDMIKVSLTTILRVVAQLPNLRPAPGPEGRIKKVPANLGQPQDTVQGYWKYLRASYDSYFPFPTSLKVVWDDDWDTPNETVPNSVSMSSMYANGASTNGVRPNGVSGDYVKGGSSMEPTEDVDEEEQASHHHHHQRSQSGPKKRKARGSLRGRKQKRRYS